MRLADGGGPTEISSPAAFKRQEASQIYDEACLKAHAIAEASKEYNSKERLAERLFDPRYDSRRK